MLEQSDVYEDVQSTVPAYNDTVCTQAFTPQFDTHLLRAAAGTDGYLSDPGYTMKTSLYHSMSDAKPYHFLSNKPVSKDISSTKQHITTSENCDESEPYNFVANSLTNLQLTPLQDISCITPSPRVTTSPRFASQDMPTVQRTLVHSPQAAEHDQTFEHMTQDDNTLYSSEDTYGLMTQEPTMVNTATSPIRNLCVKYIETQTGDNSLLIGPPHPHSVPKQAIPNTYSAQQTVPDTPYTVPPPHPSSLTKSSSELRWFQYPPNNETEAKVGTVDHNGTDYYSFSDINDKVHARRPPVVDDFEEILLNVLNTSPNDPDWGLVNSQQWRMWFEFYKGISKVNKMKSLLVAIMMGTRESCLKGSYSNAAGDIVQLQQTEKCQHVVHDKSILYHMPQPRYKDTETAVIATDPTQVCIHLQQSGYKPALYIPSHPTTAGGEWRTGGAGPLEEFIRRSNYYQCVDNVDSPAKNRKRVPATKSRFLSPTECEFHNNVIVFRDSQQRNYMFYDSPEKVNVVSITPLPRVKRDKGKENVLSKEESHLLKRKVEIMFCTAAAEGCDSLILTPHLSEGRRAPHQHIAQIVSNVCQSFEGIFRRIIIAIETDVIFHDISQQQLSAYNKVFPGSQICIPNTCSMPVSQDIILWHWVDDTGKWYPYTPKQNEGIEAYYLRGETYMSMKGPDTIHPGYVVDFNYFTIKSASTHSCRRIGRFKLVYDKIVSSKRRQGSRPTGNWVSVVADENDKLYQTAVDETLCPKQSVANWQWLNEENNWVNYTTEQCSKLEEAYITHGTACVILNIAQTRYSVNTFSRVQTNTLTGKQRKVQRVMQDVTESEVSPRMTSTPTPKGKPVAPPIVTWEHQGSDKSWMPFDNKTSDLIESTYSSEKPTLTVVFNYQAYWIYLQPYMCLIDPKNVMEEFSIRRNVVDGTRPTAYGLQPQQLFAEQPVQKPKPPTVRPVTNSTMIEDSMGNERDALYSTAKDFSNVLKQIESKGQIDSQGQVDDTKSQPEHHRAVPSPPKDSRARTSSTDSIRVDANNRKMQKTFMRHPSVIAQLQNTSIVRDPAREFSWEWKDGDDLWHSLPDYISCFLEPASKTQGYGGVNTSKLTNGIQKVYVQANFNKCEIAGHIPGYPTTTSSLRRVEVCRPPDIS